MNILKCIDKIELKSNLNLVMNLVLELPLLLISVKPLSFSLQSQPSFLNHQSSRTGRHIDYTMNVLKLLSYVKEASTFDLNQETL